MDNFEKTRAGNEIRICKIPTCKRKFKVKSKAAKGRSRMPSGFRSRNCKTCSRECSRILRELNDKRKYLNL